MVVPDSVVPVSADARVTSILARYRDAVVAGMRAALDVPGVEHVRLMRFHLGWEDADGRPTNSGAGKMLRPALCLMCCEAAGGDPASAMPAAVAIELLHNFSLIHDDIEDQSETRHGRETLWRRVGIAQAINAGDGMFAIAQRTLLNLEPAVSGERVLRAARVFNDTCVKLCEGQHLDLSFESRQAIHLDDYEAMIQGKTAELVGAAAEIGAIIAGTDERALGLFRFYGTNLGLAFQRRDDILGIWGEPRRTGKAADDDLRARKKTYPVIYAMEALPAEQQAELRHLYGSPPDRNDDAAVIRGLLEAAGARNAAADAARARADAAIRALAELGIDGEARADLEALAQFAVTRDA
jgi:geranylgeranyl diphosphate synthase type I